MADWFKFYENAIDEPRFATAITELPEVLPVFVLILSEHCKHKSPTVSWSGDDYELRGFARKLGMPVERFNAAVALLKLIQYIDIADGQLTTLKWNDLQSNYCQKKARPPKQSVQTVSAHSTDSVRQEERRGEERRVEKKKHSRRVSVSESDKLLADEIYGLYPKKVGKPEATKAILKQLKDYPFEVLKEATAKLAGLWSGHETTFLAHPSTWFNQQRFNDSPETWAPKAATVNGKPQLKPDHSNGF